MRKNIYWQTPLADTRLEPRVHPDRPGSNRHAIPANPSLLAGMPPCIFNPWGRGLKPPLAF